MTLEIPPIEDCNLPKAAPDFDFITDRLAIGNVASRAVPGFVAVVSVLATAPWDELYGAPPVPDAATHEGCPITQERFFSMHDWDANYKTPVLHIDICDGEGRTQKRMRHFGDGRDLADYLHAATRFITAHISRGCVLVHCGAGMSRSVAVVCAYLCRYAGMSYAEAIALVKSRRPVAAPADCFVESIKHWLRLDDLATKGPRK